MMYAQFNKATGLISATNTVAVTLPDHMDQVEVDDSVDGGRYKINLDTREAELLPEEV